MMSRIYLIADLAATAAAIYYLFQGSYMTALVLWIASEVFSIQSKLCQLLKGYDE